MKKFELMDKLLEEHNGILRTSDIIDANISKTYFAEFIEKRDMVKESQGVYISKDAWADPMYLLQLRFNQAIYSHDTALFLHDLTDQEPLRYTITLKTGYNTSKFKELNVKAFTIKKDLHDLGEMEIASPFGNPLKVYNKERTVCDIVRSRSEIEIQTFQDALKKYSKRKDKDLDLLMKYAKTFRVSRILNQYLEVLL